MTYLNHGHKDRSIAENILRTIALPNFKINYRGEDSEYPPYAYIDIESVSKETVHAALTVKKTTNGHKLIIKFWFGENYGQARAFYHNTDVTKLNSLKSNHWKIGANLNLSHFQGRKHIWVHSLPNQYLDYFNYWVKNIKKELKQRDVPIGNMFLIDLHNQKLIDYNSNIQADYNTIFSGFSFVNINPGFQAYYEIDVATAQKEDKNNNLDNFVKIKMEDLFQTLFGRSTGFL